MDTSNSLEKEIAWQIGYAVEGILRYRALGLKEMEAWSRGRLVAAKAINGEQPVNILEAYRAFKKFR